MNLALMRANIKANWVLFLVLLLISCMYMGIMVGMYEPGSNDIWGNFLDLLPEAMVKAMGFALMGTGLTGFIGSYYYGFLVILFPMIFTIMLNIRLVSGHVDSGSMAYLLTTPHNRRTIVRTQAVFSFLSALLLIMLVALLGLALSAAFFPGDLEVSTYLLLNIGALATFTAIGGICFFFSCLFNETKGAAAFGAGIPVLFFLIDMLASVSPRLDFMRNMTLFTLYDTSAILSGQSVWIPFFALFLMGGVMYFAGMWVFQKKDLPI